MVKKTATVLFDRFQALARLKVIDEQLEMYRASAKADLDKVHVHVKHSVDWIAEKVSQNVPNVVVMVEYDNGVSTIKVEPKSFRYTEHDVASIPDYPLKQELIKQEELLTSANHGTNLWPSAEVAIAFINGVKVASSQVNELKQELETAKNPGPQYPFLFPFRR